MDDVFASPDMASGYARSRPAVHPAVIDRVRARLGLATHARRVLDLGCGAGRSTAPLGSVAGFRLGVDPVEAMLRLAVTVAPGARFAAGRAEALPVRSRAFDLVTAAGSLNFADPGRCFPEIARVLAPDGVLVVYDFGPGRSFVRSSTLDEWFDEFSRRYPKPDARTISPDLLPREASGFGLRAQERFVVTLPFDARSYADYVMTETGVEVAVRGGVSRSVVREWCAVTLDAVFGGETRDVRFAGYAAYLVTTNRVHGEPLSIGTSSWSWS